MRNGETTSIDKDCLSLEEQDMRFSPKQVLTVPYLGVPIER